MNSSPPVRTGSLAYVSWCMMRYRCNNPKRKDYPYYGGRGIKVCKRWDDFDMFFEDMGEREKGMTLDRTDPEKDYSPENCSWKSRAHQSRNQRRVRLNEIAVRVIRHLYKAGVHPKRLAAAHDIGIGTVYNIVANRQWVFDDR